MSFMVIVSFILAVAGDQRDARPAPPAAGSGSIQGIVTAADTGRPARRTAVTLSGGEPKIGRTVETDDQGAFAFADVPAGEFLLTARKPGYLESMYGQKQPGSGRPGLPVRLDAGQQVRDLTLTIARGASISGRVLDEVGDPASSVSVRVHRWVMRGGERTLQPGTSAMTDDRGIYRIPALAPGEYVVAIASTTAMGQNVMLQVDGDTAYVKVMEALAGLSDELQLIKGRPDEGPAATPRRGFAPAFFPGVRRAVEAERIVLGPGDERTGIDFNLQVMPLAQVSGVVTGSTGPVSGAVVRLTEIDQPPGPGARTTRTTTNGRFTIAGVPPGTYRLTTVTVPKGGSRLEAGGREAAEFLAKAPDAARATQIGQAINAVTPMWGSADVAVDGRDVADVSLALQPGMTVSGRVVTSAAGNLPPLDRMTIGLVPVGASTDPPAGPAAVDAAGRFMLRGVTPGRYRPIFMGGLPPGWSIATALFNGRDIADEYLTVTDGASPIDGIVTLTNQATEITGQIVDAAGQPGTGVTIIAFAADERFWIPDSRRIESVRPSTTGRYQIRGLPPGDYRIVAVADVEPGQWFDPEFLRALRSAVPVTLASGSRISQDFRIQ